MTEFGWRWALMLACLAILAVAFGALLLVVWRQHRARAPQRANFHRALWVEIVWVLVPCVIVALLVWPTVRLFWTP